MRPVPVYHRVEFIVVWSGSDKHQTIAGDYARYPDHLSAVAGEVGPSPRRQRGPTHPCACGCGRLVRAAHTWARGHHAGRRRARGLAITIQARE